MPTWAWRSLAVLSVLLLTASWTPLDELPGPALPLTVAGAALSLFLFLHWRPAARVAGTRPLQWLGEVSFSLYLVHEPLLIAVAFTFPDWSLGPRLAVTVPLALAAAWGFFLAVELPAQRWAHSVRRRTTTAAPRVPKQPRPAA